MALLRSGSYLILLALAAVIGVPVSAVAYGFLALVSYLQKEIFTHLPHAGFPVRAGMVAVGGVLASLAIRYLPGRGGPLPADGFKMHGPPTREQLPGVILAALATLIFGAAPGPEMPLILLGGGLAALAVRLARRPVPDRARAVVASAGSFAAISTLLGSPPVGAFLLMEASDLLLSGDPVRGGEYLALLERAQPPVPPDSGPAARLAEGRALRYMMTGQAEEAMAEALAARATRKRAQLRDEWSAAVP